MTAEVLHNNGSTCHTIEHLVCAVECAYCAGMGALLTPKWSVFIITIGAGHGISK